MKITRVFNNNAVMALDPDKGEVILLGSGIGYYKKKNDEVDTDRIETVFVASENSRLIDLISQIPASYLNLTDEIVRYAREICDIKIADTVYLSLTDHIYFALDRIKEKIDLENPYLYDIKHFYQKEYQAGLYAKSLIKKNFGLEIPDYEVGYITMHIIENSYEQEGMFKKTFEVIEDTVNYLRNNYLNDVEEDDLPFTRLMTHVKFFARRYVNRNADDNSDEELSKVIQENFKEEVKVVNELSSFLKEKYGYGIFPSEVNYLVLHIRNCKKKIK